MGPTYNSNTRYLGEVPFENGVYGIWYTSDAIPAYKLDKSGNLVPIVENGVTKKVRGYIGGNYLRTPVDKSAQ